MRLPCGKSWLVAVVMAVPGLAGPELASGAELEYPLSVAAGNGSIYLADRTLPGVWKIADGKLTTLFQGAKQFRTPLNAARCVAVDAKGRVVAGDSSTREIYRFDAQNMPVPLTKGGIGIPMAIAFDSQGDILVCDLEIHRIVKVPEAGGEPTIVAEIPAPRGIAVDGKNRIWVVTHGKDRQVARILPDGQIETVVEGRPFQFPHAIALDGDLNAYICDGYGKCIWKVGSDGNPQKLVEGPPLAGPVGIAMQGDHLLVADPKAVQVFSVTLDGKISAVEYAK
ncbi:MAG: hypothetical protein EXS05_17955 [Planctomycetaceae bacterium]|nr:hypothetical protein [Planctomycetaceae bacterium]